MSIIQRMLVEAQEESRINWEVAQASPMKAPTSWSSYMEAVKANPGYSFYCYVKGNDNKWRLA